jgi:capsular exopolysaccharide synthesis family protein
MELRTYLAIVYRRKWLLIFTAAILMALAVTAAQVLPESYSATARLRVKTPAGGSPSYVDFNIWYADRLMNTYTELAASSSIRDQIKQQLGLEDDPDLTVSVVPASEIVKITAKANTAQLSADIANALAELIVAQSRESTDITRIATNEFLNQRLNQVSEELAQARQEYEEKVAPLAEDQAKIETLSKTLDQDRQLYITLEDNYQQLRTKDVDPALLVDARSTMNLLNAKIEKGQDELELLQSQVNQSIEAIEMTNREINLKQSEYANLISMLDESKITALIQENTLAIPVIDPAITPTEASSAGHLMIYAIGLVFSLGAAIVLVFLVDNLDPRLMTTEQILAVTQLPLLGKIPSAHKPKLSNYTSVPGQYREALRRLRITLWKIMENERLKSLILCSADPLEGKSLLTASLAIEFALAGKKVILVDADMRKPSLNKFLGIDNSAGLSEYLAGQLEFERLVGETAYTNLKFIPGGQLAHRATELAGSERIAALFDLLAQEYQVMLVDAPAMLAVSDVDELANHLDGAILVVERFHSQEQRVLTTARLLHNLKTKALGVVINRAEASGNYYYYDEQVKRHNWLRRLIH